jgi:VIT1/CCC1 family predicted Fe2+/Mn2+ transporter
MFSAWMIGFLLLMAALVWVAVVIGLPQPMLGLVVLVLLAIGVTGAVVGWRRARRPPR